MARKKNNSINKSSKPKKKRLRIFPKLQYRNKQQGTSIFFLVWSIFTVFAVVLTLLFGITQQVMMVQTYKKEAKREISEKGAIIRECVLEPPPKEFGGNFSGYLRFLAIEYDVHVFLLDKTGEVLFPQEHNFDPSAPDIEEQFDFSDEIKKLLSQLKSAGGKQVVYEHNSEYIYGSQVPLFGEGTEIYLYVSKSFSLMNSAASRVGERMTFIAIFVFILSFSISSAVSGWLTKPIHDMTEQARALAKGNFDVDFNGGTYGQEMVELAETLNYARDELSKTNAMQRELIANVSHDFKTPLTMIKGYASMIVEISGDNPEKRNKHAQVIIDEADRLAGLVNDVLDLSKIQSGIEQLEQRELDMSAYTEEVLERFAYLQETQGYVFIAEIEKDLYTVADELKIGQVLYNLIGNAVNYTGEDKKVHVRLYKTSESTFRFSVTDTGSGIKQEELSAVWDRYYRASEMHKRPVKGMGLGLSIVKSVLEKHNFHFGIDTAVGKGSTFYVDFPLVGNDKITK